MTCIYKTNIFHLFQITKQKPHPTNEKNPGLCLVFHNFPLFAYTRIGRLIGIVLSKYALRKYLNSYSITG